ncbi:MAG: DUF2029 domain-containing protein [Actinobacteria bacterium]|nr:DUF2029 domain-containing protein [Actinomycetota bacterium]
MTTRSSPRPSPYRWSQYSTSPATNCGVSGRRPSADQLRRSQFFPVRILPVIAGIILLASCWFAFPGTAFASDPRLTELEAKQIAAAYGSVQNVIAKHPELERSAAWDSSRGVWHVFWTNPENGRRLIDVQVDDATSKVLKVDIKTEAYGDVLPLMTDKEAIAVAQSDGRVSDWLADKSDVDPQASLGDNRIWTVSFYSGGNNIAEVLIDDTTGLITEVRIGPQVAWQMARGYNGAFGRIINEPYIWLPLCFLFLAPFVDVRNPFRLLHLDLLALLSFTVSHYYFNQGDIFTSVPLTYPPLAYIFLRMGYMALRRPSRVEEGMPGSEGLRSSTPRLHLNFSSRTIFIALMLLLVFRITINVADSNVVDVGYSGVIGAHRILEGQTPYGNMPSDDSNGDTYGPLNYLVYVPFERVLPWSGSWDDLPAAHATAIFFDLAAVAGMYFAGRRLAGRNSAGRRRIGLALAWGWAAFPYTTFVLSCNVNDSIVAAFLIWGFVFLSSLPLAGVMLGLAASVKFFPAILGPLWASFPRAFRGWGKRALFVLGFILAAAATVPIILIGNGSFTTFWERSLKWQLGRDSPFSIWGQHTDTLAGVQHVGQYVLIALALGIYFWPPRKSYVQVAAASAALVTGFEIMLTHWFYLYIPWFFPLAFIAFLGWTIRRRERSGIAAMV